MTSTAAKALVCAVAGFCLSAALLFALLGAPASTDGAIEAFGRLFAMTTIAALLAHWIARKAAPIWSWPKFSLVYAAMVVALLLISSQGRAHGANRDDVAAAPYHVNWPDGWDVQHLQGASSAPQDAQLGSREMATKSVNGTPAAVIAVTCIAWHDGSRSNLDAEMRKLFDGTAAGYEKRAFKFSACTVHATMIGKYAALQFELTASNENAVLKQALALAFSPACYLSATFSASPASYVEYLPAFDRVKSGIE